MPEKLPPKKDFNIISSLGKGGNAEVFLVTIPNDASNQLYALKLLYDQFSQNPQAIDAFINEAKLTKLINHPNICKVYDTAIFNNRYAILMEYIHGKSLQDLIILFESRSEKLPLPHMLYLISKILHGLHATHTLRDANGAPLNIIHRDISPHNILITYSGEVKIIDFGIAENDLKNEETKRGIVKGKLAYMSPEQALGNPILQNTDIYATALILYRILAGFLPTDSANQYEVYQKVVEANYPSVKIYNHTITDELESYLLKALQKDPGQRYQTALQFNSDLERYLLNNFPAFSPEQFKQFIKQQWGNPPMPTLDASTPNWAWCTSMPSNDLSAISGILPTSSTENTSEVVQTSKSNEFKLQDYHWKLKIISWIIPATIGTLIALLTILFIIIFSI